MTQKLLQFKWDKGLLQFKKEQETRPSQENQPNKKYETIVRKSPEGLLILSDRPEKKLLSHLESTALLEVIGGPILTVACAGYLAHRFKAV